MASRELSQSTGAVTRGQSQALGLKRFSAQVSYTTSSGYGCSLGFKGGGKTATPAEAILALIVECGIAAVRAGCDDIALGTFASTIDDARAALAKAEGRS